MNGRDVKGWRFTDKAGMVLGFWAFALIGALARGFLWMTRGHVHPFWRKDGRTRWPWAFYASLASWGYLYEDWRNGDMPEHVSKGGVWR